MTPRISVIMPVFNSQRYLSLAIESILTQSYRDFEFLIFDDGSTDKSVEIIEKYQQSDSRIRLWKNEHRGLVPWLNQGFELAQGEFVARMDSDDVSLPSRFQRQVEYLEANPECVVVGCQSLMIDSTGEPIAPSDAPVSHEEIDGRHIAGGGGARICHPAAMMRKHAVQEVGAYKEEYRDAEDLDLYLRLAEQGGRLANMPELLFHYRIHSAAVGVSRRQSQLDVSKTVTREAYDRRGISVPDDFDQRFPNAGDSLSIRNWMVSASLKHGYWKTARRHALAVLLRRPWSRRAWERAVNASFRRGAW